jgi:cell division septum initiation protein DivIVA
MSDRNHEPQRLLESLLAPEEPQQDGPEPLPAPRVPEDNHDVDVLVDELEVLFTEARRVPFGRRLMIDEDQALDLVDRLRAAIPGAVRQAHRVLEEQERILNEAREQARRTLHERGLMAELEIERERMIAQAEQESERMTTDADAYVRSVLSDLEDRLTKIQASVRNGLEALESNDR